MLKASLGLVAVASLALCACATKSQTMTRCEVSPGAVRGACVCACPNACPNTCPNPCPKTCPVGGPRARSGAEPGACIVPSGAASAVSSATADDLRAALSDEQRAQAYYGEVIAKYGDVRPFANVIHAEERHEALLTALMERHGVTVPPERATNIPAVPATFAECSRLALQLEHENIAMYDRMLTTATDPDIRAAFENLRAVSLYNHVPAFERWSRG